MDNAYSFSSVSDSVFNTQFGTTSITYIFSVKEKQWRSTSAVHQNWEDFDLVSQID